MCMLTFYRPGAQPDADALTNGAVFNDDGHGFAIVADRKLIIRHGLHFDATLAEFKRLRAEHPDGPALFHSRMGTHGDMSERNCHPFRIGGDRRTVIAHNGILPAAVQPSKDDPRCDTRIAAEDRFREVDLADPAAQKTITEWMGRHNKIVILTVNPQYPEHAYILNEAAGIWIGDTWYSNYDFLPDIVAPDRPDRDNPDGDECWLCCSAENVLAEERICLACDICLDCGEQYLACQCYTPYRTPDESSDDWAAVKAALALSD